METRDESDKNDKSDKAPLYIQEYTNGAGTQAHSQPSPSNGVIHPSHSDLSMPATSGPPVTFLDRISLLPEIRPMPWRRDQELPPEKSTQSPRVQQRGACMVATRGRIMSPPCAHCAQGFGRFSACIVLDNWFQGACATCMFTSKGNRCSLRIQKVGDQDARALRYMHDPNRKRKRDAVKFGEGQGVMTFSAQPQYVSPYPALPIIPRPPIRPLRHEKSDEQDMDSLLQAQIAREEADQGHLEEEDHQVANTGRSRDAKATAPLSNYHPRHYPPSKPPGVSAGALQTTLKPIAIREPISAISPHTVEEHLIDTFPKSHQRQIFALMSGIQGGLKNLQKELSNLKEIIGVEEEQQNGLPAASTTGHLRKLSMAEAQDGGPS